MSSQQNPGLWTYSHLSPELPSHLNSRQSTLSPLQTPNGSFESLRNISPGSLTPVPNVNGDEGFSNYHPVPQIPSVQDLHSTYGPYNPHLMPSMQNFQMLRTLWGPPQYQSNTPLHSPAGLGQPQPMMQPNATNAPLQNTTAEVVNAGTTEAKRGRKRKNAPTDSVGTAPAPSRRRRKTNTGAATIVPATAAAICGVGPVSAPSSESGTILPTGELPIAGAGTMAAPSSTSSISIPRVKQSLRDTKVSASDVWYFMWAVDSPEKPEKMPENQPRLMYKPDSPYVACRLCGDNEENPQWKVYKVGDGMTPTCRNHLHKHGQRWKEICAVMGLKNSDESSGKQIQRANFTIEMFYHLLLKWIAVDDQSFNVVECPEFRELLLYLGEGKIQDRNLPHRTKLTEMILTEFRTEYCKVKNDLKNALGRISHTTDLWSDPNLDSFMALTAHFMARDVKGILILKTHLVAFRFIEGAHTGAHLGLEFLKITDDLETSNKLGQITMDNASNNNTLMVEIEGELTRRDIPFDHDGNRLRCFPHVVNLAVQAILAELKKNPRNPVLATSTDSVNQSMLQAYARTLECDPVGQCRAIVSACRSSGQRRRRLQAVIQEGNENGFWRGKLPDGKTTLPTVQLLRDCVTRWSSTFKMVDRVLTLNPAIQSFLLETQNADISDLSMDAKDTDVLRDIHQIIEVPHVAQELLSSERTPTLSMALPAYEVLNSQWTHLRSTIWELSHYIDVGLDKLKQYINEGRKTRIYALSMIVNPSIKLEWLKEHWEAEDVENAREWMLQAMTSFRTSIRVGETKAQLEPSTPSVLLSRQVLTNSTAIASRSLSAGFGRMNNLKVNVRRSSSTTNSTIPPTPTIIVSEPVVHSPTLETTEERSRKELELDRKDAECEFSRYDDEGVLHETAERNTDIIRFWEKKEHTFPLLFRVAMDVLPAQASSVPSERIFSSSKETCTLRRSNLSPATLEALQVLKFIYKQDRLNFTEDLVADERDYTISGPVTPRAVDELMAAGNLRELDELLQNARDIDYN